MRDIKFRAWDKGFEMMYEVDAIRFFDELIEVDNESDHQTDKSIKYELMQYTGLLDKNGVKIYEGDVIEIREVADYIYEPNKITTFHKGCFGWRDNEAGFLPFCILDAPKESIEVIGNIYENPHLLECD